MAMRLYLKRNIQPTHESSCRIDILHEHLGFEHERIHAWGLAQAVLSAWWSMQENTGWEYAASFAGMIAELNNHTASHRRGCRCGKDVFTFRSR